MTATATTASTTTASATTVSSAPVGSAQDRPDPHSVYRVLQVVSSHPHSWEEAARSAITELSRTITDLRVARVVEQDVSLSAEGVERYRVKLAVSYRIDRRRVRDDGAVTTVRRVLLVANRTAAGPQLMAAVRAQVAEGPTEFHVLVPVLLPGLANASVWGDPFSGYVGTVDTESETDTDFAWSAAEERLQEQLQLLRQTGAVATGELRPADPLKATLDVLGRASFDEIILSTLPASVSRWLHLDLPRRLARHTALPITHIEQVEP